MNKSPVVCSAIAVVLICTSRTTSRARNPDEVIKDEQTRFKEQSLHYPDRNSSQRQKEATEQTRKNDMLKKWQTKADKMSEPTAANDRGSPWTLTKSHILGVENPEMKKEPNSEDSASPQRKGGRRLNKPGDWRAEHARLMRFVFGVGRGAAGGVREWPAEARDREVVVTGIAISLTPAMDPSLERGFLWRTEQTYREWAVRFAGFITPRSPYVALGVRIADRCRRSLRLFSHLLHEFFY